MTPQDRKRMRAQRRRADKVQAADAVGYGKPPKRTQFQPGRSGNPAGRPRGKKTIDSILQDRLMAPMAVTADGKQKKLPAIEVIIRKEINKALQGDQKSTRFLFELFQARGLAGPIMGSQEEIQREAAEIRERLRRKLEAAIAAEDDRDEGE